MVLCAFRGVWTCLSGETFKDKTAHNGQLNQPDNQNADPATRITNAVLNKTHKMYESYLRERLVPICDGTFIFEFGNLSQSYVLSYLHPL